MKICCIVLFFVSAVFSQQADYYWRPYNGEIPEDAVEGGTDGAGKPIYIGQGYFHNVGLLPGTLHAGSVYLKVTADQKLFGITHNIKILCSRHAYAMNWVQVTYRDIATLTEVHLVEGGTETDSTVHIGRARFEGDLEIGKIYNVAPYEGFALPNREGGETLIEKFDILTFNTNLIDGSNNLLLAQV